MRSINPASALVLVLMGLVLLGMGITILVKHYIFIRKPYETVEGEITGCEKEVHHYRTHITTLCHAKLKFEYDGAVREVVDSNAVPERIYDGLYYCNTKCRIRIPERRFYDATLDYAECLNVKRNQGLLYFAIGAFVIFIGLI